MDSRCEGCLTRHCNGCWVDIARNSTIRPKPIKKKIGTIKGVKIKGDDIKWEVSEEEFWSQFDVSTRRNR